MGYYINQINGNIAPNKSKAEFILNNIPDSKVIDEPKEFINDLVCIVDNRLFEGAGYCFSKQEFEAFAYPDGRPRTWMIVPGVENIAE